MFSSRPDGALIIRVIPQSEETEEHWSPFHPKTPGLQQDVGSCSSAPALPGGFGIFSFSSCCEPGYSGMGSSVRPLGSAFHAEYHIKSVNTFNNVAEQFLCPHLQPLPAAATGAIHTQFCGSRETTKAKVSFFQQKFPLTGSPAINSGIKKAREPAVTMLL